MFLAIKNTALTSLKKQKAEKHLLLSYFLPFGTVSFVPGSREVLSALFTESRQTVISMNGPDIQTFTFCRRKNILLLD